MFPWHPFTYDFIHVKCAKEIKTALVYDFDSTILYESVRKCGGRLWYKWNEKDKIAFDITCDKCNKSFHPDQLELFNE